MTRVTLSEFMAAGAAPYEAYGGPETGGFGVLPQSAVPAPDPWIAPADEPLRQHPFVGGLYGTGVGAIPPASSGRLTLSEFTKARATPGLPAPSMPSVTGTTEVNLPVNQSVVTKGGAPRQVSQNEAAGWELFNRMHERTGIEREAEATSAKSAIGQSILNRGAEAFLTAPSIFSDLVSYPRAALTDLVTSPLREGPVLNTPVFGRTPVVTTEDILGAVKGPEAKEAAIARKEALAEAHPYAVGTGNVIADVLQVGGPRFLTGKKVVEHVSQKLARREAAAKLAAMGPKGVKRYLTRAVNSTISKWARKTGARVGETSAEGAGLAVLHGGDPVEQASYAAAGQLGGSSLIALAHHPVKSLIGAVVLWQTLQNLTPLQGDSIDWTAQKILDKQTMTMIAGAGAGVLGAGRLRGAPLGGKIAEDFPRIAEGINAALRTNPNSIWEQFTTDRRAGGVIGPVMSKLSTDVSAFKPDEIRRLERAALPGGDFNQTITEMAANPDFRKRMGM